MWYDEARIGELLKEILLFKKHKAFVLEYRQGLYANAETTAKSASMKAKR